MPENTENENIENANEDLENTDNTSDTSDTSDTADTAETSGNSEAIQWYESDIYGSPETYDFKEVKLPDGVSLAEETTKEFEKLARESNLSQTQANKYLQLAVSHSQFLQNRFLEAVNFQRENKIQKWDKECEASEDLKGEKYNEAVRIADLAIEKLVPQNSDFLENLKSSGLNHHPVFIRVFKTLGEQMLSPNQKKGTSPTTPAKSMAEVFYPNMMKK